MPVSPIQKQDLMLVKEVFEKKALEQKVVNPTSVFFCPGSLLRHEYDTSNPVAFGMPDLVMEDLSLSDPNPFIGELVKLRADFWNNATVPARFGVEFIVTTGNFTPKKLASEITDISIGPGERITVEGEWVVEAGFTLIFAYSENLSSPKA